MNYLDKYDNFVMKKCLDTRRVNTFELNNLANGRVTKSHFGGYVAQKPLSTKDLVIGLSNHGFNSKEVLKGLDIDALLLEINQAGVQIEQIFGDDLEQMFADLPVDEEDSQGNPPHTPERTEEPEWLRDAERTLQRIQTPQAQRIGNIKTSQQRQESRQSRRFHNTQSIETQTPEVQFFSPQRPRFSFSSRIHTPILNSFVKKIKEAVNKRGASSSNVDGNSDDGNSDDEAVSNSDVDEDVSDSDVSQDSQANENPENQLDAQPGVLHSSLQQELQRNSREQRLQRQLDVNMNNLGRGSYLGVGFNNA